jgi:hypothetical protein
MGFTSLTKGYQLVAANKSSVAELNERDYHVRKGYEALFAEVSFRQAHSGLTRLMVGSLHLDHVESKKPVTIAEALIEWAQMAEQLQVDVVGCSWNSGRQVLEKIMACQKGGMIIHTPGSDCTGFLVPAWSKLLQDAMPAPRCSYFNVPVTDLGSGTGDADSHWMVAAHWRRYENQRQRTPAAAADRKKRGDAARTARKRAGLATGPETAASSASAAAPEQPAASSAPTQVEPKLAATSAPAAAAAQATAAIPQAYRL